MRQNLGGSTMAKPHPIEICERVVAHVEAGNSNRLVANLLTKKTGS